MPLNDDGLVVCSTNMNIFTPLDDEKHTVILRECNDRRISLTFLEILRHFVPLNDDGLVVRSTNRDTFTPLDDNKPVVCSTSGNTFTPHAKSRPTQN